jgi:hypothetical protein
LQPQATSFIPDDEGISPSPSFNDLLNTPFLDLSEDFHVFDSMQSIPPVDLPSALPTANRIHPVDLRAPVPCTSLLPDCSYNLTAWSLPPLSLIPGDFGSIKTAQKECDTTLCTVAYEMICQHNKKGVDMIEIGIRLWNGFIKGDRDEGCKVEKKLLFSVLDYIRG